MRHDEILLILAIGLLVLAFSVIVLLICRDRSRADRIKRGEQMRRRLEEHCK